MLALSTRQAAARIRVGTLKPFVNGGEVECSECGHVLGQTESVKFWSKGDSVFCDPCKKTVLAKPVWDEFFLDLSR